MNTEELGEIANELVEISELESSEIGEWWYVLGSLYPKVIDSASEDFRKAWEEELRAEYEYFLENYKIVSKEVCSTEIKTYLEKINHT